MSGIAVSNNAQWLVRHDRFERIWHVYQRDGLDYLRHMSVLDSGETSDKVLAMFANADPSADRDDDHVPAAGDRGGDDAGGGPQSSRLHGDDGDSGDPTHLLLADRNDPPGGASDVSPVRDTDA